MAGPSFRAAPVRVRVPATSANLGPGFDAFGLALARYDEVVVRIAESGLHLDVAGESAEDVGARPAKNLVVRALRATFDALGGQPRGLEVVCANRIPHGKGLGSSAAAIVAGVTAARNLVLGGMPDDDALAVAVDLEGHPDNVAAALHGGVTVAWRDDGARPRAVRLEPHQRLRPVAFVPASRSSTAKSRRLLPETVPHTDAAYSAARAGLLTEALTRRPELLLAATDDRLHQPYRATEMPRSAALVASFRERGIPAVLSGGGPSVLAFLLDGDNLAADTLAKVPLGRGGWVRTPLAVDTTGATVVTTTA
ncbi:MAG: homoserine kinase [Frankia sp.]|nr:homoserine kinase [Frankia sp.]